MTDFNSMLLGDAPYPEVSNGKEELFHVRYQNSHLASALVEARGFSDVERAFRAAGYKGRIVSVKLAV